MERSLGSSTVDRVLEELAAPAPAPAGGSAAALAAAMAAALVAMVGRGSGAWDGGQSAAVRALALRERLVELAEEDMRAVAGLLAAARGGSGEDLAHALVEAVRPPLAIAEAAAEAVELAVEAEMRGKAVMRPDAAVAAALARAGLAAALLVVEANLGAVRDGARGAEVESLRGRAAEAARRAEAARPDA